MKARARETNRVSIVSLIETEDGDWVGLYVNGELIDEGHSLTSYQWIKVIKEYKHFDKVDIYIVDEEIADKGFPVVLTPQYLEELSPYKTEW